MKAKQRFLKRIIASGLCALMAVHMTAAVWAESAAATKDENVYVTLNPNGSVSGIYVINEFTSEKGGEISDYGNYTSVENLTDQSEIYIEDDHITAKMAKGQFYYQGNMDSGKLPWDISIKYFLDGEGIDGAELAGKSGELKIQIETRKNSGGNEVFFDNYLLQATVVLSTEKCHNIQAEGATAGNVGVNRQLVYTILPGEEKHIEITAEVENFEMDAITFQGVPMSLGISEDMLDDIKLSEQTKELTDAVALLDDGVGALKKGTEAAAVGGKQLADGISQLAGGSNALETGGNALSEATALLVDGTKALQTGVNQYTEGVDGFAAGVEQYVAGVEMLSQGAKLLSPLESLPLVNDAVVQMYQAVAVGDESQGIPSLQAGAQSLSDGLHMISEQVKLLETSTDGEKLQQIVEALAGLQTMTTELSDALIEIGQAVEGSAGMIEAVEAAHQAVLADLNNQVDGVNGQISEINHQIQEVNGNISASVSGVNSQIDNATAAIQAAADSGALDSETAAGAIASLNASKVSEMPVSNVTSLSGIQMPEADENIQSTISGLKEIAGNLKTAAEEFSKASEQLKLVEDGIAGSLSAAGEENPIAQLSQALSAACDGADGLKAGVDGIGGALKQLSDSTASFGAAGEGIAALNDGFEELCKNNNLLIEGSQTLTGAKAELHSGVEALASGTAELNNGAGQLAEGIVTLNAGVSLLNANTGTLTSGLSELDQGVGTLKEGTEEFRSQTDNMDEKVKEQMEEMLDEISGENFEPVSFTSEKNTNIGLVQFAMTTEGIKLPETEQESVPEEEEGFVDRLKQLFF